jgi:putative flippase GtrA
VTAHRIIVRERPAPRSRALLARRARPLRFAIVGGATGAVQLGVLALLVRAGLQPLLANAAAFALSAQMNFVLSQTFTWRDRNGGEVERRGLAARWAAFHACISGGAVANLAVFALAIHVAPHLLAAVLGILAGASLNFLTNDRLTFRRAPVAKQGAVAAVSTPLRFMPVREEHAVR